MFTLVQLCLYNVGRSLGKMTTLKNGKILNFLPLKGDTMNHMEMKFGA